MTPTPDGATELFTTTTDRALPITGLLRVTDRHPGNGLRGTGPLLGTDRHPGSGHQA